jgi:hypothetical protein
MDHTSDQGPTNHAEVEQLAEKDKLSTHNRARIMSDRQIEEILYANRRMRTTKPFSLLEYVKTSTLGNVEQLRTKTWSALEDRLKMKNLYQNQSLVQRADNEGECSRSSAAVTTYVSSYSTVNF